MFSITLWLSSGCPWSSLRCTVPPWVDFLPSPLKMAGREAACSHPRVDLYVWLNIAVTWGRTASGCLSSSLTDLRQKLIFFAELFGKARESVWICSVWCLNFCAFSLLRHLNSSVCDFFLRKDWCFWRLVKWQGSTCFWDAGFNLV